MTVDRVGRLTGVVVAGFFVVKTEHGWWPGRDKTVSRNVTKRVTKT